MAFNYQETLDIKTNEHNVSKLKVSNLLEFPYKLPQGIWSADITTWPYVKYPDIYEYLINSPGKKHFYGILVLFIPLSIIHLLYSKARRRT